MFCYENLPHLRKKEKFAFGTPSWKACKCHKIVDISFIKHTCLVCASA